MSVSGCGCFCHAAFVDISSNSTRERDRHSRMYIEDNEARKWIFRNRFLLECDYRKRKTKIQSRKPKTKKGLQTARVMYWMSSPIQSRPNRCM